MQVLGYPKSEKMIKDAPGAGVVYVLLGSCIRGRGEGYKVTIFQQDAVPTNGEKDHHSEPSLTQL